LEARVPKDHPLRTIRDVANDALCELSSDFAVLYAPLGRPSIPPEKLLRASLLQAFYSIRTECQLMERLEFDLLFRWFVGLGLMTGRRITPLPLPLSVGLRLFKLVHASTSVPSTEKCCDDNSRLTRGRVRMAARNLAAISPSRRRSQFFENTE
jgi:hypothetical protein